MSVLNTMPYIPTGYWIPTVSLPSTEYLSVPMAPTLVCSMFVLSGSVLVTQASNLVSNFWVLLHHQYNKQHITIGNTKPDPEPPPT